MTLSINSFLVLLKHLCIITVVLYAFFRVFNYFYTENYCNYLSASVIEGTLEDIKASRVCVSSIICETGEIERTELEKSQEEGRIVMKNFSCVRKYKPGVWKR